MNIEELNDELFQQVTEISKRAGEAILEIYETDFEQFEKGDKSPLTSADLAAHKIIVDGLSQLTPSLPVLSEESSDIAWSERQQWQAYWLVDPLDGTKEFIKKNGEFTVNIALIENGEPTWGVVYVPVMNIVYAGGKRIGAATKTDDGKTTTISVAEPKTSMSGWRIVGSRSHQSEEFKEFIKQYDEPEIISMGSSLKICLVAEGQADIYPRLGPTSEWDTAAAHAVLLGAGGSMTSYPDAKPLVYNQKESVLNPFFVADS